MCGRFTSSTPPDQLARYFGAQTPAEELIQAAKKQGGNFNVAPTQGVYTIYEDDDVRRLDTFHWGLVPFWAKDPKIGSRMINARAETVAEKNSFKRPFARTRCIVPADGFYEWKKVEGQKKKQPMYMSRADGEPLAFAGLWEVWKDRNHTDSWGEPLELYSCTIITCDSIETVAEVHDRMPVMLEPDAWDIWLDRNNQDIESFQGLLVPALPQLIKIHPVSTDVNKVGNNSPELINEFDPVTG
jgi:putative SOS response-associated peptidase YedK